MIFMHFDQYPVNLQSWTVPVLFQLSPGLSRGDLLFSRRRWEDYEEEEEMMMR